MNSCDAQTVRDALAKNGQRNVVVSDLWTEVGNNTFAFSAMSEDGYEIYMVASASDGRLSFDDLRYRGTFATPAIRSALRKLSSLCEEEDSVSRPLARAAGCEILEELCRLSGAPQAPAKGGLAPWAKRRCIELMHARLSEDISLDELAAEARLSVFHFARMFKQSVGVPPRVYLTRLRIERACELLEMTDLPVSQIAQEVGYSSNQVLARVFVKHRNMSPTEYRRAVSDLDPARRIAPEDGHQAKHCSQNRR
jgi:AraC family transcriptional regulator